MLSCPRISQDILDLGLWDLTLPPRLGHAGLSQDIPGHLEPGTLGPYTASTAGTCWVVPGYPRTSWTWDSGTLHCLQGWDMLGCPRISQDILDLGLWDLTLPPMLGHAGLSQEIPGHLGPGTLGPYTASKAGTSWVVPGYPRTSWTWDSGTLHCLHNWDMLGCPRISQDILDLGLWDLTLPPRLGHRGLSQDIPGHLGPGTLGPYTASTAGTCWVVPGYPRTSWTWDSGTLHCLHGLDIPRYPRTSWTWDSGTLHCLNGWDILGCPRISQDILDLGLWDLTLPPRLGHAGLSQDIPGHLGPGTMGPYTASKAGTSWVVLGYPRTSWTWESGTLLCLHGLDMLGCPRISQDILDLGLWDLTLPPRLGHAGLTQDIPGHVGPGNLGPYTASTAGTSWVVPGYPRTSWTWDSGTLHCLHGWDIVGCPRISQDILDLGIWDLALPPWLGHSKMSQEILDLGLWDLTLPPRLVHAGLSQDIPGHLGPGTLGPYTAFTAGTSWVVPGYPRTSWTWDSGTLHCLQGWDMLGCPRISQDILDLGLWDLTLPPRLGHPGLSQDIPGHLGPGTLGPYTASTAGTSWVVPGYPRTSWTWDSGTLHCLHGWDIVGCPRISQDILDLGLWDLTLPPRLGHAGLSQDIPGHLGPGTLGPYTASKAGTCWVVPGYPRTSWTWDSGTLHCLHGWDIVGCPRISQDILDLGLWDLTLPPRLGHRGLFQDIPGHLGSGTLGPYTASMAWTSQDVPGYLGLGTLGPYTASKAGTCWVVPGYPRTSWTWDSGTIHCLQGWDMLGCPRISQDILDLGLWDLTLPPRLGHAGLSQDIPGHLGPGTLGPYTDSKAGTCWVVPGYPRTSWTWDSGTLHCLHGWDIVGCPRISQDILDLGLWDLTLPPWLGHPKMSQDIPGHLGPGTLGPYTASMALTSQDVPGYPRTSWTWDSGTLHCLHGWDMLGCPRISQDILDLGLWDLKLPTRLGHRGLSQDIPGHLGPGTLGPYTASTAGTSWVVPGYPRTSWTWDSGTLHCLHGLDIPRYPWTSWTWDSGTLHCLHG